MEIKTYILCIICFITTVKAINPYIEVVISPIVKSDVIGEIRLIWDSRDFTLGDRVVLYRSGDAIFEYEPRVCSGSIDTNSFVGDVNFTHSASLYCTIYSAGYLHNNDTVAYACLQNSPTWMYGIKSHIENLTLPELFIPGTHDSASYVVSKKGYLENILQKYVYTQDISVYEQLVMGARYIDLRIGYYNHPISEQKEGKMFSWWCNHDFMPVTPLTKILKQIRQFMINTNEIVIVDFHNFPIGFNDVDIHVKLGKFIISEMSDLVHQKTELGYKESLSSIWKSGKRLIISYNKKDIAEMFSFFEPIKQYWGNKQSLPELYTFLNSLVSNCNGTQGKPWVAMAEVTPTIIGVLTDWYGGLRNMADKVNTNLTLSYKSCHDWGMCSNIISVDFIRSTGLVTSAIAINKAKGIAHIRND